VLTNYANTSKKKTKGRKNHEQQSSFYGVVCNADWFLVMDLLVHMGVILNKDEALRLALEALENAREFFISTQELGIRLGVSAKDVRLGERFIADRAITAIKAALANEALERKAENARELGLDYEPLEAKDEPVGLIESLKDAKPCCGQYETCWRACTPRGKFIGQRDAQRTWVGLTDMEIDQGLCRTNYAMQTSGAWRDGVEWAEAKLKEKNT
jgi:hypothetical protein